MAKRKGRHWHSLSKKIAGWRLGILLLVLSVAVDGGVLWMTGRFVKMGWIFVLHLALIVGGVLWMHRRIQILKAGADGEKEARKLLEKLPDDFTYFADLTLRAGGRESQIDFLLISSWEVLVLEVKNVAGTITGKREDNSWMQKKSYGGKGEAKRMYNPLKQAEGHKKTVELFLREHGCPAPVTVAVYFVNPKAKLQLGQSAPVFSSQNPKELIDFIGKKDKENRKSIQKKKIIECFVKEC